jgi:hypothetical protein
MNRKRKMVQTLTLYFMEKGKILNKKEYKAQQDKPYRVSAIANMFTSWSLIPKMIQRNYPEEYEAIMNGGVSKEKEAPKVTVKETTEVTFEAEEESEDE